MRIVSARDPLWLVLIAAVSLGTIALSIFSLSRGVHEIFPYLYLLPIIMVAYLYPTRGVSFSLVLGGIYMLLVYFFGLFDLVLITISTAWFYVIVSVGVVMSSLSEGLLREGRKFHSIFENSQTGLFTIEPLSRKLVEVNQQCARMLAYVVPELMGKPLSTIWPDEQEQEYVFSRISEGFHAGDQEVRFLTRLGEERWILISAAYSSEKRIVCSIVDITERKQIERAMMDSEIKFRNLVEKSLAGVFVIQKGMFQYVNPRFAEIHGYTPSDLIGKVRLKDLVVPEEWETVAATLEEALPQENHYIHYTCREGKKDGSVVVVEVLGSRTIYQGELAVMGTLLDVTEKVKAEHALQQVNNKLNLLSSITRHDILNHLTAVQGYMGLAMDATRDQKVRTYLNNATSVTNRTQSLLAFTRDYQNMGDKEPEWQDLMEVIFRSSPIISSPRMTLLVRLEGVEVLADLMLEKVFYNLMDNTLRHGEHATEIRLSYCETDKGLTIIYEDNGVGISHAEKHLIFRRGYGKNTGFGLFLIREILAITGIGIDETGEPGKGARFEITVPRGHYRFKRVTERVQEAERGRA